MSWAGLWFLIVIPFLAWGLRDLRQKSAREPLFKPMVGLVGAAIFVISCMPVPVPAVGTCTHPCGTGMGAILIGPALTVLISGAALLLQALFLSHGGLTTLGANTLSMGVVGALSGWAAFHLCRRCGTGSVAAAFAAGMIADLATYTTTAFELATALHPQGELWEWFTSILIAFMPTQLPLAVVEGFLTAGMYRFIAHRRPSLLHSLGVGPGPKPLYQG